MSGAIGLWFQIWFRPRATIRTAISLRALPGALVCAIASGIVQALVTGANHHVGAQAPVVVILFVALWVGALWGLFQLALITTVLHVVGRWTNTPGTLRDLGTAIGWASVPVSAALPVWLFVTALMGGLLFVDPQDVAWTSSWQILVPAAVAVVTALCILWWWFILVKAVAEVRQISTWAALGHLALGFAVLSVAVLGVVVVTMLVLKAFHGSHSGALTPV
jgi:hypothetical protein